MKPVIYTIRGTQPVALTFTAELELIRDWIKTGNVVHRDKLIANYLLFTVKKVRQLAGSLKEDEILEIAHAAIMEAINKHEPDREKVGRLCNLIPFFVRQHIRKYLREREVIDHPQSNVTGRYLYLDAPLIGPGSMSDGGACEHDHFNADTSPDLGELLGVSEDDLNSEERALRASAVSAAVKELSTEERALVHRVFVNGENLAEIGRTLPKRVTRERIRQRLVLVLTKLRDILQSNPIFQE